MIKFVSNLSGLWFSPGTPVSSTNKTDHHDITEILLKVVLNTIKPNQTKKKKIKLLSARYFSAFVDKKLSKLEKN